jgi:hypothetical protein
VSIPDSDRKLGESLSTHGRDCHSHPKNPVFESGDDVVVREAVDGVDEVRLLAERVGAARSDADFERELDRANGGRSAGCVEVPPPWLA